MRPRKVNDQNLLEGLMGVLQSKGYEGASLNDMAKATGLQKASLYHRFPDGKKQITVAVLTLVESWVDTSIVAELTDNNRPKKARLKAVLNAINELYAGGNKTCILRALAMDTQADLFGEQLKRIMTKWVNGFAELGGSFGQTKTEAKIAAEQTLVLIQGSLVVSKAMKTLVPFQKALKAIERMYQ